MSQEDFRLYQHVSKDVFSRLVTINELINRLDRLTARSDLAPMPSFSQTLSTETSAHLNRIIRNPRLTVGGAMESLQAAIRDLRSLLDRVSSPPDQR